MSDDSYVNGSSFTHGNTVAPSYTDRVLPLFSLKGRTAIISGAGAGIGLAVAYALAEAGANVAIWYNSNRKAISEAENIAKTYGVRCKSANSHRRQPVMIMARKPRTAHSLMCRKTLRNSC